MLGYKALPQSEELAAKPLTADVTTSTGLLYSKPLHALIYILLSINAVLLVANACASASVQSSLATVLPVHDPRTLAQPDQYAGIPETSRYKSKRFQLVHCDARWY